VSDVQVFTVKEVTDLIRAHLQPLAEHYAEQARRLGGGEPEVRAERTHWICRAQGVTDAIEVLLPAFGVESPGGRQPSGPALLRERQGSPQAVGRVASNRGPALDRWAS
jgi:hypothetical protein